MKNREKYADEIIDSFIDNSRMAVNKNGKIDSCRRTSCGECLFSMGDTSYSCTKKRREWLEEEYKKPEVDWTKVPVDTKVHVRNETGEEWLPRYFAGTLNGKPMVFIDGATSFSCPIARSRESCMIYYDIIILAEDIRK